MNLLFCLLLFSALTIPSKVQKFDIQTELIFKKRNSVVNILINKLIEYIRYIITHGSEIAEIPTLDPFELQDCHFLLPIGYNLELQLKNVSVTGLGGFVIQKSNLHLNNLTFEIELYLPRVIIVAENIHICDVENGVVSSVPIYSKNKTVFEMDNFRLQANLKLKQSENKKSIVIDEINDAFFEVPSFKVISEGIIDEENIHNFAKLEKDLVDYLNRCRVYVTDFLSKAILTFGNTYGALNYHDTFVSMYNILERDFHFNNNLPHFTTHRIRVHEETFRAAADFIHRVFVLYILYYNIVFLDHFWYEDISPEHRRPPECMFKNRE